MRGTGALLSVLLLGSSLTVAQAGDEPKSIAISAQEFRFTPNTVTVRAGQRIKLVLTNKGTVPHEFVSPLFKASKDLEIQSQGIKVEGDEIGEVEFARGKVVTVELTPTSAGRFQFWCGEKVGNKLHRDLGMKGTIVVTK
jgi:uncharacterized cupredoxin-like copper-binding protein